MTADRLYSRATKMGRPKASTPFADAVLGLGDPREAGEEIVSFHALPLSRGNGLRGDERVLERFRKLLGGGFLDHEVTYSGEVLDSFFRPTASLDHAQHLAAQAFGADRTFFVTCGTTLANQVAFDALCRRGDRVLLDRTAHQSLHVAAAHSAAEIEYGPLSNDVGHGGQPLTDVAEMIARVERAAAQGAPFDTVVLAAASYDGLIYDLHAILEACARTSPSTRYLVDEAWSAIFAFHPELRRLSALDAARRLAQGGTPVTMVVTHSAHKSMNSMRQGSYLHVAGDSGLADVVASILHGRHTTSPSVPILASLDLARAHAVLDGEHLLDNAMRLAERLRNAITSDPDLAQIRMANPLPGQPVPSWIAADPTKVLIEVDDLGLTGAAARSSLFRDYGIYVCRTTATGFLVNFHIGIDDDDLDRLLDALRSLASRERGTGRRFDRELTHLPQLEVDDVVDAIVIAYPPGVPLAFPGEAWTEAIQATIEDSRRRGADIVVLAAGTLSSALAHPETPRHAVTIPALEHS